MKGVSGADLRIKNAADKMSKQSHALVSLKHKRALLCRISERLTG